MHTVDQETLTVKFFSGCLGGENETYEKFFDGEELVYTRMYVYMCECYFSVASCTQDSI